MNVRALTLFLACGFTAAQAPLPTNLPRGWERRGDALVGAPHAAPLDSGVTLANASARVEVELQLADGRATAASLVIGGSHVGFCGRDGRPFVEGPLFGGKTRSLDLPAPAPGEAFKLVLTRRRGSLLLDWNGAIQPPMSAPDGDLGAVRLRPHRDTMTVRQFVVTGGAPAPQAIGAGVTVWNNGEAGVDTYRIPALVVAGNGDLLAFAEARHGSRSDTGDIDIVMKRSRDGGRTWSAQQTVWDDGPNTCGNPCPVVVSETGAVVMLTTHNLGKDHESQIIAGTSAGTRTVWLLRSEDHGATWSAPREVTATTKLPSWTWYATGPGAGVELRAPKHRGRLVIPCDHIEAETKRYFSHVIYSDDRGATWQLGGTTPQDRVNECEVVELRDGRLLLNMRNYDRSKRTRQQAVSDDGGRTWRDQRHVPELTEPICQASIRRFSDEALMFSNPASRTGRERLVLRFSFDEGQTWPRAELLDPGPAAYSCLQRTPGGGVVCLYEAGGYREIRAHLLEPAELPR